MQSSFRCNHHSIKHHHETYYSFHVLPHITVCTQLWKRQFVVVPLDVGGRIIEKGFYVRSYNSSGWSSQHFKNSLLHISVHRSPTYSQKLCCFSRIKKLFGSNTLYHRTRRLYFQSLCLSFVLPSFCLIRFVPTRFTAVKCGKFVGNKWYSAPLTTLFILHNFISNISKFTLLVP